MCLYEPSLKVCTFSELFVPTAMCHLIYLDFVLFPEYINDETYLLSQQLLRNNRYSFFQLRFTSQVLKSHFHNLTGLDATYD